MTSLHQLAEEDNLPIQQNIDRETLDWIIDNKPEELRDIDYSEIINSIDMENISKLTPDQSWFTSNDKINSLHGIRHLMRVAIYATYLSLDVLSDVEKNSVILAALLHDIRRETDKGDEGHANRGSRWYLQNKDEIHSIVDVNEVDEQTVAVIIEQHEKSVDKTSKLLNILKTADALDRYVQPKKKWWIDEQFLAIKPSTELKAFAFDLVVKSEAKYLNGSDSVSAVIDSLNEMKS